MINVEVVGADVLAAHEHLVVRRPRREDDVARFFSGKKRSKV